MGMELARSVLMKRSVLKAREPEGPRGCAGRG